MTGLMILPAVFLVEGLRLPDGLAVMVWRAIISRPVAAILGPADAGKYEHSQDRQGAHFQQLCFHRSTSFELDFVWLDAGQSPSVYKIFFKGFIFIRSDSTGCIFLKARNRTQTPRLFQLLLGPKIFVLTAGQIGCNMLEKQVSRLPR